MIVEDVGASEAEQRIARIIREPIEWKESPPLRLVLFRVSTTEHWLLRVVHHVLHDGWEYEVFLRELFECYDALTSGRNPVLPPLTVQFADFALWQRRQLEAGRWDGQLEYWRVQLRNTPPPTQVSFDRPRGTEQSFAGAQIRHPLAPAFYEDLLAASAAEGVTPSVWLFAAFLTFLFRYTGQTDIIVGTGMANRQSTEAQRLLGMIINTLPLRVSFVGQPSFREVLLRTRVAVLGAMDHQDVPFDHIVRQICPGATLFHMFFDTYDRRYPGYQNSAVSASHRVGINNGTAKFDLVALVVPGEDTKAALLWEYNTDLFFDETARRMMHHFLTLLEASVADPHLPVAALRMMSEDEIARVIGAGTGKRTH